KELHIEENSDEVKRCEKLPIFQEIREIIQWEFKDMEVEVTDQFAHITPDISGKKLYIPYTILENLQWLSKFLSKEKFKQGIIDITRHERRHIEGKGKNYEEIKEYVDGLGVEDLEEIARRYEIPKGDNLRENITKALWELGADTQTFGELAKDKTKDEVLNSIAALSEFILLVYYGKDGFDREVSRKYLARSYREVKDKKLDGILERSERLHWLHRKRFELIRGRVYDLTRYYFSDSATYLSVISGCTRPGDLKGKRLEMIRKSFSWIKRRYAGIPFQELRKSPYYQEYKPLFKVNEELLPRLEEKLDILENPDTAEEERIEAYEAIKDICDEIRGYGTSYLGTLDRYHRRYNGWDFKYQKFGGKTHESKIASFKVRIPLEFQSRDEILEQAIWLTENDVEAGPFQAAAMKHYEIYSILEVERFKTAGEAGKHL
ncbi:MAG: hypothetical protein KAU03_00630, partial [Candidatus Altiarchaeales archaeon]|nr:hypothetical protein [Candidatus Altiarchaeales archaeon]